MSLPEAFVKRINLQFPERSEPFLHALDQAPWLSVRTNPNKPFGSVDKSDPVLWCDNAYYLAQRPVFTLDPLFHAGCYYPQEASSMFVHFVLTQLIPDRDGVKVLDLCAAPGGKSTLIASYLHGNGLLVANETIRSRAFILTENVVKWGMPNVVVTQSDPSRFSNLPNLFDVVLVDAPCSGEGMFRKDSVARAEWSEANADLCASRQRRIVSEVWPTVKEGGYLIYSTCTFNPAENEVNLNWLLQQFDAEMVTFNVPQDWGINQLGAGNAFGYSFMPHRVRGEGFFCSVVRKCGGESGAKSYKTDRSAKKKNDVRVQIPKGILKCAGDFKAIDARGKISALPMQWADLLPQLESNLNVFNAGVTLGEMVKNDFAPDHALALSVSYNDCYPSLDLPLDKALDYLRGETQLGELDAKGWAVAKYQGVPLGFVKNIGNRFNNYYPKEWRIRMK